MESVSQNQQQQQQSLSHTNPKMFHVSTEIREMVTDSSNQREWKSNLGMQFISSVIARWETTQGETRLSRVAWVLSLGSLLQAKFERGNRLNFPRKESIKAISYSRVILSWNCLWIIRKEKLWPRRKIHSSLNSIESFLSFWLKILSSRKRSSLFFRIRSVLKSSASLYPLPFGSFFLFLLNSSLKNSVSLQVGLEYRSLEAREEAIFLEQQRFWTKENRETHKQLCSFMRERLCSSDKN